MRSHTAGFVKPINDKADGNVGEQGVERADFGVNRNFQSCSLSFLICNMQIIRFLRVLREVKYHIICKMKMLAILQQTTVLIIRIFVHDD